METRSASSLAAGFMAGLLLTGLAYWRLPYNAEFLSDGLVQLGLVALAVISAALAAAGAARAGCIAWLMLAIFPLVVAIRAAVEISADPTSHNLWPFELVFSAIVAAMAVVPGVIAGTVIRRMRG